MLRGLLKGSSLVSVAIAVVTLVFVAPGPADARQGYCDSTGNTACNCDFEYEGCVISAGVLWCPYDCDWQEIYWT